MSGDVAVRLAHVSRFFGPPGSGVVRAVDDVTLDLPRGTFTVLMGPSGSGKTTLLSLMGGLLSPTQGTVEAGGVPLSQLDQPALTAFRLRHVGMVFQAFHLIDALTVRENVELPLTLAGRTRPASGERAAELVERLGLGHRRDARPRALSGGEQQRCAIARALANDPVLVLADEPTGSLDERAGADVIALLHAEAATHGRSVVVASHDPRMLRDADAVVRLDYGRVAGVTPGDTPGESGGQASGSQ
jgi:putative ABC transport system ATP-binding protein